MKKAYLLCLWLFSLIVTQVYAQEGRRVTGRVTSADDNQPLPGATIAIKGTTRGTNTDAEGRFSLTANTGDVLSVTFVGMKPQEVTVTAAATELTITLESDASTLNEVVAIGYGTARKKDLTGAVATLKTADIVNQPVVSATQAMQGKLAGVQITASGEPGSVPTVRIRGTGTLLAGADPLYVVDGVITDDIRNINPQDITSMDVLKDASATAIYGMRAANGVILVTTKRGQSGAVKVTYDGYVGFRQASRRVKMADSQQYIDFSNEALVRAGQQPVFTAGDIKANTNWFNAITRNALVHNHNISLSGGSEKSTYFLSGGYMFDDGILKGNGYRRLSLRASNDYQVSKSFKVGASLNLAQEDNENKPYSAFTSAYKQAPIVPVYNEDGSYGYTLRNNVANPLAQINYTNDHTKSLRLQGVLFAEWNITSDLRFRSNFAVENRSFNNRKYNPIYVVSGNQQNNTSQLTLRDDNASRWVWDNTLTYTKTFGEKHSLNALVGVTGERYKTSFLGGSRLNVPNNPDYWTLNLGTQATATNESSMGLERRLSYYGRVNYNYDDRYLVTATVRQDGSSKFPSSNRSSIFPSVGAAWQIANENFMKGQNLFSALKLRASWGQVGNDRIVPNAFLYTLSSNLDYQIDGQLAPGYTIQDIKDLNLRWEVTTEKDLGLEFGLLNNRLSGEVNYYDKLTKDALIYKPIDAIFGDNDSQYLTNAADIRNRGIEFGLNWNEKKGDFRYNVGVNFTINNNKIERVNGGLPIQAGSLGNGQITTQTAEGQPIGSFYVYQTNGIFKTQAELDAYPHISGAKVGDLRYVDTDGNGIINGNDRVYKGSYQPKYFFGLTGGISYRNFDLSVTAAGNLGNQIYNGKKAQRFGNENIEASVTNWWSPSNTTSNNPRPSNDVALASDYYIESGSYLRINNVSLGYNLPKTLTDSWKMQGIRVYVTAQNLVTFQKFSGFTPELPGRTLVNSTDQTAGTLSSGIELDAYPTPRTFLMGVTVNF